ncbi:hypothetical protein H7K45_08485 [Mycobacterium yunnanensis]|uniref:PE-PPE domain-containing protein n=1 Tax=Mycobacterium yunnanensis TaxID=368477 RepID=A0A9X3BSY7_9MYCO|nr:hypothetical protein [Mycobacterium yunnanensis]MCV7420575.1 hypothetical protein [Mycobacterium yunnanensis]
MIVHAGSPTRLAAALLAAGVMSAAATVAFPEPQRLPAVTVDVADAAAITDAFVSLGKSVQVLTSLVGIHVDATISVPFEATLAVMAAQQHPELTPNVLSYLVQRFVNPSVGPPVTSYPWETEQTAALVASLLPYPLGPSSTDPGLVNEARLAFAAAFDSVLGRLPDLMPGYDAVRSAMNDSGLGGTVVAGQLAARAPLYMAWSAVNYVGNLPANVAASVESAIVAPQQIPGLMSNLVYGLLSPDANVGLIGQLLDDAVDPFTWLPAPIGSSPAAPTGLANQVRVAIVGMLNAVLSLLPAPVTPSELPSSTAPQSRPTMSVGAGKGEAVPSALPSASLVLNGAVHLAPVRGDDISVEPIPSATRGVPRSSTDTVTPSIDDAPQAAVDTDVTKAAGAAAPEDGSVGSEDRSGADGEPSSSTAGVRHGKTATDGVTRPGAKAVPAPGDSHPGDAATRSGASATTTPGINGTTGKAEARGTNESDGQPAGEPGAPRHSVNGR